MVMGTPLFHTEKQFEKYSGQEYNPRRSFIVNNRVTGFHLGLLGDISKQWSYRTKFTYTNNYGAYQDQYEGAMSWDETPNYYYKGGLYQCYSFMEVSKRQVFLKNLSISGALGYDWGKLYHTLSGSFSLCYTM